jgi:hypothetical protein
LTKSLLYVAKVFVRRNAVYAARILLREREVRDGLSADRYC